MTSYSLFNELLNRITQAGNVLWRAEQKEESDPIELCEKILGDRGEATGLAIASHLLELFDQMGAEERLSFFSAVSDQFSVDEEQLKAAIESYQDGDTSAARRIHFLSEPRSQELFRRLNRVRGGTYQLVKLRESLLDALKDKPELRSLDDDLRHLFSSWFNRGFLELRRIDWSTSAEILEKIITHEAVHEIKSWADLQQRVAAPDRRLYGFFHPAIATEPLIFVEVALTNQIPDAIAPILEMNREHTNAEEANTAVFYSISNCQKGLRGISFGNFLIKQVVEEISQGLPGIKTFITLSPVPGLRRWIDDIFRGEGPEVPSEIRDRIIRFRQNDKVESAELGHIAAWYLVQAKRKGGKALDGVANFHLGNGALLHAIHTSADLSSRGLNNAYGVMVNYLYSNDSIETNHENYVNNLEIAISDSVRQLMRSK